MYCCPEFTKDHWLTSRNPPRWPPGPLSQQCARSRLPGPSSTAQPAEPASAQALTPATLGQLLNCSIFYIFSYPSNQLIRSLRQVTSPILNSLGTNILFLKKISPFSFLVFQFSFAIWHQKREHTDHLGEVGKMVQGSPFQRGGQEKIVLLTQRSRALEERRESKEERETCARLSSLD